MKCYSCAARISQAEQAFSLEHFSYPICRYCQDEIRRTTTDTTTPLAVWLFIELKGRGVPVELEKHDGFKTIDLAVVDAKLNIELDGMHHHGFSQALADLKRTAHSLRKGYITLRIPNTLVRDATPFKLHEIVDYIVDCAVSARDLRQRGNHF